MCGLIWTLVKRTQEMKETKHRYIESCGIPVEVAEGSTIFGQPADWHVSRPSQPLES
jgi:hypothetical protein